jgi:polar amino acid transport system substrate-binding protein
MRYGSFTLPRWLLCVVACAASSAWGQSTEVWNVCLPAYAVPPYLTVPGEPEGITQRLIQDSARRAGIKAAILRLPPALCIAMLERGEAQAIIAGATERNLKTLAFPQRAGFADANKRLAHLRMIWLKSPQSRWGWNGTEFTKESTQPLVIGTLSRNQVARDVLERLGAKIDAVAYDTQQLLAKVAAGRVDGVVMLQEEFELLRDTPDASLVEALQRPFAVVDYYLVFRKGAVERIKELQGAWWSSIAEIRTLPAYQAP